MSFLSRLFSSEPNVTPEDRSAALAYLVQLNALRALQDDEAANHNRVLAKYGGSLTPGGDGLRQVAEAAAHMAQTNSDIVRRYSALSQIPDVAGQCYFAWSMCWLLLEEWSSRAAAAYEGMYEGALPPAGDIQQLLAEEARARHAAEKEEGKLLKRLGVSAEEARRLIEEGEQVARSGS